MIECINFLLLMIVTVKEHYTGNKTRNAQVREDLPRARVEQEMEALRYQTYIQQQLVILFAYLKICIFSFHMAH